MTHSRAAPAPAISVQPRRGFADTNPVSTATFSFYIVKNILGGFFCRVFQCCRAVREEKLSGINSLEFRAVTQATGKRKWKAPILCLSRVIYLGAK